MLRVPNALLWAILRPLLRLILRFKLNFQAARVRVKGPFVLLCRAMAAVMDQAEDSAPEDAQT